MLQIDPRFAWLAVGAPLREPSTERAQAILQATQPWYQKDSSRKEFLSRLLVQLTSGILSHSLVAVNVSADNWLYCGRQVTDDLLPSVVARCLA